MRSFAATRVAAGVASVCLASAGAVLAREVIVADAAREGGAIGAPPPEHLEAFHTWLLARGAEMDGVKVAPSADPTSGLALIATQSPSPWPRVLRPSTWLRTPGCVLATFPLESALTVNTCCLHPVVGPLLSRWLADDTISEREAVQLFLLVQRARGTGSEYAPYVSLLSTPSSPLCWTAAELDWLRGTTLWEAVRAQQRQCALTWQKRMVPLAKQALALYGVPPSRVSEDDWRWAVSVFWSRALIFPEPGASTQSFAEGIVPGLDMANHGGARANGSWAVERDDSARRWAFVIRDSPWRSRGLTPGTEVVINYGNDRPSEEMLFVYGFLDDHRVNPADSLLVTPVLLDPDDEVTSRRNWLLVHAGLEPRAFLPASGLRSARDTTAAVEAALRMLVIWALTPEEVLASSEGWTAASLDAALAKHRTGAALLLLRTLEQRQSALLATGTEAQDEQLLRDEALPPKQRAAVAYRRTQKKLAAHYLQAVRNMLARM
jgi:hypothetical protein